MKTRDTKVGRLRETYRIIVRKWIEIEKKYGQQVEEQRRAEPTPPKSAGRSLKYSERHKLWEALSFVQKPVLDPLAIDYHSGGKESISTKVILGKNSKFPLILERPIIIADMSFGALSEPAHRAFALAATRSGIAYSTGEGGILPGLVENNPKLFMIVQFSSGRFSWPRQEDYQTDEEFDAACAGHIKGCAAICLKLSQGAKPGQGGLLKVEKITDQIAKMRRIPKDRDCHSPAFHPDIKNPDDLKKKIAWLKKISGNRPVIIKFAAGHIEKDIQLAIDAGADIIELDGAEGGTGAAPHVLLNEMGIDTLSALVRVKNYYKGLEARGRKNLPELVIGGGIETGADIAKCLALGADAVMIGTGFMKALGCEGCGLCYLGKCPKGIAAQDPKLTKKLDWFKEADKVKNNAISCTEEVKNLAASCGKNDILKLDIDDLRCENSEVGERVSKITGAKMMYEPDL